jgi:septal ring factor EnvC (AmiA/AmiB activator)
MIDIEKAELKTKNIALLLKIGELESWNEHLIELSNKTFRGYLDKLSSLKTENERLHKQLVQTNKGCEKLSRKLKQL